MSHFIVGVPSGIDFYVRNPGLWNNTQDSSTSYHESKATSEMFKHPQDFAQQHPLKSLFPSWLAIILIAIIVIFAIIMMIWLIATFKDNNNQKKYTQEHLKQVQQKRNFLD